MGVIFEIIRNADPSLIITIYVAWGLLNYSVMKAADNAVGDNPPHGAYWVKGREFLGVFSSILAGPFTLPLTVMAYLEWRKFS